MNDEVIGFLCCLISGFGFGSMFAPLRNFDTRDGFFVQWVQGGAIMVFGLVVNVIRGQPTFQPGAALAGFFWSTANITALPIINKIGAGIAMLVWGSIQVLIGWAIGTFGLFGLKKEVEERPWMNYVGLTLTLMSGIMFSFVRYEPKNIEQSEPCGEINHVMALNPVEEKHEINEKKRNSISSPPVTMHVKLICIGITLFAGIFRGGVMAPVVYVQQHVADASQEGLDYVMSHYSGAFVSATFYFVIYCCVMKNKPYINTQTVLPSIASGLLWSFAMAAWIVSSKLLSEAISFPISTRLPGCVGSFYDVFIFKAIKGTRNLLVLASAITVALIGVFLVGLSK